MSQRLSREPGWYPDAIGNAAAFRWWNGTEWTTAVADTLWAPEPEDPQPYHRPQHPVVSAPVAPRVVELDDEPPPYRKPLLIGAAAMVVAAGLFAGGVWVFGTDDDPSREQASDSSTGRDDRSASRARPEPGSSPGRPADSDREDERGQEGENGEGKEDRPALPTFPEPGDDWVNGHGVVPHSQVRRLITEEKYNGEEDWGAIIVSGELPQGVTSAEELSRTANEVGQWFGEVAFGADRAPDIEVLTEGPILIADRPAYSVRLRVDYEIEGLKADWDRTTVAVVDLGPGQRPGVFISSVPNTHPELRKVADEALSSVELAAPDERG